MTEPNDFQSAFAESIQRQLPPALHDPRYIAQELLRRDQWRTRVLAGVALFFWLIGAGGMLLLSVGLNRLVIYLRINNPGLQGSQLDDMLWGTSLIHHSLPFVEGSVLALLLAALFTVMLIFSSRQATLTRINISLMQISEQVQQLRQAAPEPKRLGGGA